MKWRKEISFEGNLADDHANALVLVRRPFEAQMVSGPGQLKMSRWQVRGGTGLNGISLHAVRKISCRAGGENFHFAVHDLHRDAAKVFRAKNLPFPHERISQRHDG